MDGVDEELRRLEEDARREMNWKRWGTYLGERQWGTVREDYSEAGTPWLHFPHEQARSRAYRWGEDGILGWTDRECRLCFAVALWNGRDPILKERLFGLGDKEGNHGEDVKECYYHLDAVPTSSYAKGLYKYPQAAFPYGRLVEENRRRDRRTPEFELVHTGVFDDGRYFDVFVEYAKAGPDDTLIRIAAANRGPEPARLHLVPTLWFRNTWTWGCTHEGCEVKPRMAAEGTSAIRTHHVTLGRFRLACGPGPDGLPPELIFTDNETNRELLYGVPNPAPYVKDAFHDYLVQGRSGAVNPHRFGTKAGVVYAFEVPPGGAREVRLRLHPEGAAADPLGDGFDGIFEARRAEADAFYSRILPGGLGEEERRVARQAYAGLLWSRQFYHYVVKDWLEGDPEMPPPPPVRKQGRNGAWLHLFNRDVVSVPDKWEYPWYAAWDLAFHMLPFARVDPEFAKAQLVLFLREWYMHPNGQLPAYEYGLSDVNPPVHAWACWRTYKMTGRPGRRDRLFLARVFQKLVINFTWWVNRKDPEGRNLFSGGFLGLDNIGVFDRSRPLPGGGYLEQADATAWMAFACGTLLSMALELAREDPAYEDMASKFFEHFVAITDAMNSLGGTGLWDERDGFYYDQVLVDGRAVPLRIRSMVGLIPLVAVEILEEETLDRLPGFRKRMAWFLKHRQDLVRHIAYLETRPGGVHGHRLLAIPSRERLVRVLRPMLDENEFLSPFGIRSLSKVHAARPFVFRAGGEEGVVAYAPGESDTPLFGGNSNWRGPVWFPVNYLLIEALERYHHFYGDGLRVEYPTGSGATATLEEVARDLSCRLVRLFLPDKEGRRPCHGGDPRYARDPAWRDLPLFHEYFHAETGAGLGAGHQTGWTALVTLCMENLAARRAARGESKAEVQGGSRRVSYP